MSFRNEDTIDKQARQAIQDKIGKAISKGVNDEYAETVKERIVQRTRLGIGVTDEGKAYQLPPLSTNYKQQRRNSDRLSGKTTPAKSNVTATGQMLNAMTVIKLKARNIRTYIFTVGDRRGRDLNGRSSRIGNKTLVKFLKAKGRSWLGFTRSQRNEITREIRQIIIKFLR